MARFVIGLKYEVSCIVELQLYGTLEEAIQLALKVERQRRNNHYKTSNTRYGSSTKSYSSDNKNVGKGEFSKNVDKGKATVEAKV